MEYIINQQKMEQAVQYLQDGDIDLWLILTSEGSDPCLPLVTGVKSVGPAAFIIGKDGQKYAMCSSIDAQDIEESGLFDQVLKYSTELGQTLQALVRQLQPKTIALNYSRKENLADGLTTGRYRWLCDVLKDCFTGQFVSSESFLEKLRSIKTALEVERIKQAIFITQDIYEEVFAQLKVGLSEIEIGQLFVRAMEKREVVNGVDRTLSMPIVMKERIAHRPPGEAIVEPGDLVIMDFSVDYEGYVSDIARTVYFLKPGEIEAPAHIQAAFEAAHAAITAAGNTLKPGVQGFEVDLVARNLLLDRGMPEITHATGHQIGRDVHDGGALLGPRWERYGNAPYGVIKAGMVFTLEPTILPENGPTFIVEENVLVTETGIEYLTVRQDELILIPL
ncbi:M24 family metallopeptidase [Brevibacillus reuszeri]|uniref:M24 family metallopeptidase n=1 Tax=Brevibacillus reuszeri TaxID=54915 RepID=UPI00289B2FDA|nr:Xaa-Pro peptidase family protein [Brevibacillus reuszeri]